MSDELHVVLLAVVAAGVVGALGAAGLAALRSRSLVLSLAVATTTTVAAVVAGIVWTGEQMFLSGHDYRVALIVCASAGVVAVALGLLLARGIVADSALLQEHARGLAEQQLARSARPRARELAEVARELDVAGERLAEGRRRERALDASRRELVAWVSHDLRTPLAGLRAMAEALEDDLAEDPARYHKQMRIEVDRLSGMVDDLFELSRIHAGTMSQGREQVLLADLVSDALAGTEPLARARGVRLDGAATGDSMLEGNAAELSRVLRNLLVNAVRHTPSGGVVRVGLESSAGQAVLGVQDACGGIPAEDLARVFDVGWRGTAARTPLPDGGGGLGLAIVRGLVEGHGGTVSVRNHGPGCRFEVRLPVAPA